ncbi:MAG: hypothetical protein M1819_004395 [Sarea resinae]|nr:MAG: hypothetical protein M1819_004395 [Sarea resinae]
MSLPQEVEASYATIIDSILAKSDLNTISEKRIRKGLQEQVGYDLTPQKAAIKTLILARFDRLNEKLHAAESAKQAKPTNGVAHSKENGANGATQPTKSAPKSKPPPASKREEDDGELSDVVDTPPPKKKRKAESVDDDAAFAARLQAEELSRARPTRGGPTRKKQPIKKKKSPVKSKSAKAIKSEDDSDLASGSEKDKKVNRSGAFHKPLALSAPLSELLGGITSLSRPQTVKKVWEHIKAHDLQDPSDKRQIICDDAMKAVFKQDRVHMFTMNKLLNQNLYPMDE